MYVCPLHCLHLYWPHTACKKVWSTQDVYRISTIGYRCTKKYNKVIKCNKVLQNPGVLFLTIYTFQSGDRDSLKT